MRLLTIGREQDYQLMIARSLDPELAGAELHSVASAAQLDELLAHDGVDLVFVDRDLGWSDGLTVARAIRERYPSVAIIMATDSGDEELAVAAMKAGLSDYVPLRSAVRLGEVAQHALAHCSGSPWPGLDHARQESESRFHQLVEQLPYPVGVCDPDGTLTHINRAFLALFGIPSAGSVLGKFNVFRDPRIVELGLREAFERVYKGEPVFLPQLALRLRGVAQSGTDLQGTSYHELTMFPVWTTSGEIRQVVAILQDITERVRSEHDLRSSEANYRAIFEAASDAFVVYEPDTGRVVDVNRRACEWWGFTADELLRDGFVGMAQSTAPYGATEWWARFSKANGGEPQRFEWLARHRNGRRFWVEVSLEVVAINGRRRVLETARDISDRKAAEEALRAAHEQLAATLDALPDLMLEIDEGGRFLDYRAPRPDLALAASEAFVGKTVRDVLTAEGSHTLMDAVAAAAATGKHTGSVIEIETLTGIRWFELGVSRKGMGEPGTRRFVVLARDVTDRQEAEEALHRRTEEISLLYEAGSLLSQTLDLEVVYDSMYDLIGRIVDCEDLIVSLYDAGAATIRCTYARRSGHRVDPAAVAPVRFSPGDYERQSWVIASGEPLLIDDTVPALDGPAWPGTPAGGVGEAARCALILPLKLGARTIGTVQILSSRPGAYTVEHLRLLEAMMVQATGATSNALLYQQAMEEIARRRRLEMAEREQRMLAEALRDTASALASHSGLDDVLELILREVGRIVPHDAANVMLIDGDGTRVVRATGYEKLGLADAIMRIAFPHGGLANHRKMIETGRPMVIPDTKDYSDWAQLPELQWVRSYAGAPMRIRGKVIGFVNLDSSELHFYTQAHAEQLQVFADQAGLAIENARLYDAVRQHVGELEDRVAERTRELSERESSLRTAMGALQAVNEALARTSRHKDEFLATMSHELRSPLSVMLNIAESLQGGIYGALNARQLRSLKVLEESGRHLLDLINDILDVSKVESGKLDLSVGSVSVDALCSASLIPIHELAAKKNQRVVFEIDSHVRFVEGDEVRLRQVLANLLSNAVKFTPEGGQIGLRVAGDIPARAVDFVVWDTGIGITPEDIGRLFQPFVQLDSRLSRQYVGTGLGLALVKSLVALHGGTVAVVSEPGQGSQFTVRLPWNPAQQDPAAQDPVLPAAPVAASPAAEDAANDASRPLILLAEDNAASAEALSDYLDTQGYRIVVASDGIEAVAKASAERPDLILMDVQMPGMDGLEAIRQIRRKPELSHLPILALTALAMPGDIERCLTAGADGYVSKPVSLHELVSTIQERLAS